jgi:hypothetical protein
LPSSKVIADSAVETINMAANPINLNALTLCSLNFFVLFRDSIGCQVPCNEFNHLEAE